MRDLSADAVVDAEGRAVLAGRRYEGEVFPTLLPAGPGRAWTIERTTFERCRTEGGFFVDASATLRDVTFVDLDCGDALHVSAGATLEGVTLVGHRPRMLWIRPDGGPVAALAPVLDLTRFEGEVSITGVPTGGIALDDARQVRVRRAILDEVDWAGLGLARTSYWRLMARKVQADGSHDGVFSLPRPRTPSHERAVADRAVLAAHGHLEPAPA